MPPKKNSRRFGRRPRKNRNSVAMIPRPPPYRGSNSEIKRYRFVRTYTVNAGLEIYNISPSKLGFLTSFCTVANTTVTGWWETCQIMSITMWANPPPDGSNMFVSIIANNGTGTTGQAGDDIPATGTSSGLTVPAYARKRFTPNMQAGQPQACATTNTNTIFVLSISGGNANAANSVVSAVTIDLVARFTASNDNRVSSNTATVGVGTLGAIYYMALDNAGGGNASMSNLLKPDYSLVTTT